MADSKVNNRRIVKNTLFLYARLLISLVVSLYMARVVLNTLGVSDFGLYNVVGGIVAVFAVIKGLIATGTQRFMTFEMGCSSGFDRLSAIFSTSLSLFAIIGFLIVVLGETIGLWFLNNKLNIPEGRQFAANIVYQVSLVSMFVSLVQLPYSAAIISHERMDIYGYAGLGEPLLRLGLIILLPFLPFDKLISYSIIVLIVSVVMTFIYVIICNELFLECKLNLKINKGLFKEMTGFTGWNMLESISNMFSNQGQDILLNLFFGTNVNASRAVSMQVKNAIQGFASNFLIALFPQITKTYAAGQYDEFYKLMIRGAKFSFMILATLMMPILINTDYLLTLWLGNPPEGASLFCQLILCSLLISMVSEPLYTGIQATGCIKGYQIFTSIVTLLNIPICYVLFKFGMPAYMVFVVSIVMSLFMVISRSYFIHKVSNFPLIYYIKTITLNCFGISIVVYGIFHFINLKIEYDFLSFMIYSGIVVVSTMIVFIFISMNKNERQFIFKLFKIKH